MKAAKIQFDQEDQLGCPKCGSIDLDPSHTDENHNEWWHCNSCNLDFWVEHHSCYVEEGESK